MAVTSEPSLTLSAGMVMVPSLPMTTLSLFDVHLPLLSLLAVTVCSLLSSSTSLISTFVASFAGLTVTEPLLLAVTSGSAMLSLAVVFAGLLIPTDVVCCAVTFEPSLTLSAGMVMLPSLPMTTLSSFDVHLPLLSLAMVAVFCLPSSSV